MSKESATALKKPKKRICGRSQKIIKDSVQGYIYVDKIVCEKIIDTDIFQRLRRIEQTSMRCLYPAASHDRFIHSMGVYNLAKIALNTIENNIVQNAERFGDIIPAPDLREKIHFAFEMAALLHDVGHAPFSHTLEEFFGIEEESDLEVGKSVLSRRKRNIIKNICKDLKKYEAISESEEDENRLYEELSVSGAAPHELMSALLSVDYFHNLIVEVAESRNIKNFSDFELIVRCITGAQYKKERDVRMEYIAYKNCIIRLLNSSIDVDKLDYISRDSSISGYDNVKIDINRLLKSLVVVTYQDDNGKECLTFAFNKNAISVIQNVITSRNSLYTWIYAHHKIKYETYLIQEGIKKIINNESEKNRVDMYKKYFSLSAIKDNLICDADIWCLLKDNKSDSLIEQIFNRNKQHKAIWKSFSEFNILFGDNESETIGSFSLKKMKLVLDDELEIQNFKNYINVFKNDVEFDLIVHNMKLTNIKKDSILIYLNDKLYGYDAILKDLYHDSMSTPFFYLFCNEKCIGNIEKNELVEYIKKYSKFNRQPDFS